MESGAHAILEITFFVFHLHHLQAIYQALYILVRQFMVLVHIGISLCKDIAHRLLAFGDVTEPIGSLEHPWISVEPSHTSLDRGVVGGCLCKVGVLADDMPIRVHVEIGQVDWAVRIEGMIAQQ